MFIISSWTFECRESFVGIISCNTGHTSIGGCISCSGMLRDPRVVLNIAGRPISSGWGVVLHGRPAFGSTVCRISSGRLLLRGRLVLRISSWNSEWRKT